MNSDPQSLHRSVFEGDNLHVLRGINSESVDLIYLDPPFNSNRTYSAPIGSKAAGAAFKDAWTLSDVDLQEHNRLKHLNPTLYALIYAAGKAHSKGMFSYLMMMAPRLLECHRLLKSTGSLYLHCDPTASHYLKFLLDGIFRQSNCLNEVVWYYRGAGVPKYAHARRHDILLWYAKQSGQHVFNPDPIRQPYAEATQARFSPLHRECSRLIRLWSTKVKSVGETSRRCNHEHSAYSALSQSTIRISDTKAHCLVGEGHQSHL